MRRSVAKSLPETGVWLSWLIAMGIAGLLSGQVRAESAAPLEAVFQGIPHDSLYDISFDGDLGYAVGDAGLVLNSNDAGATWQGAGQPMTEFALFAVTHKHGKGIIVGQQGRVFVNGADGGWEQVESGTDARLMSVDLNSSGLAFAVGGFGIVLKSTDAGRTWSTIPFDWEPIVQDFIEPHLYDVVVDEEGRVVLIGEFELILHSPDAGETWEVLHRGDSSLFGLQLDADGTGFAVGQSGAVLKTDDGGQSWKRVDARTEANLLDVWASPEGEVLITGVHKMLRSRDRGATWWQVESPDVALGWYQGIGHTTATRTVANGKMFADQVFAVGFAGRIVRIIE